MIAVRCTRCHKPLGYPALSKICGACAAKEAEKNSEAKLRFEAGLVIWATQGIGELGEFLANHTAFAEWLKVHGLGRE